jgi:transcriptional regulator with XRE-family HTH domain
MLLKKEKNNPWNEILAADNEEEAIEQDAQMIMFRFLSEIERFQKMENVNRKTLAEKIKTSASYITQLFRGDRPLNILSVAKMGKALNIEFDIRARLVNEAELPIMVSTNIVDNKHAKFETKIVKLPEPLHELNKDELNKLYA